MLSGRFPVLKSTLGLLLGAALLSMFACTGRNADHDKQWMTRIPNTEHILVSAGSMLVSPGEEWITFLEGGEVGIANGLASVELASGRRVEHHFDLIPDADLDPYELSPYPMLQASRGGWAGWYEGKLYLDASVGRAYVVVNSEPAVTIGSKQRGEKMFSDGPELFSWYRVLENRPGGKIAVSGGLHTIAQYSAAWSDGRYDATTYAYDSDSDTIVAREEGRNEYKIVDLPRGGFDQWVTVSMLRVSPDEGYLAYVASYSRDLLLSPWMLDELHVVHLETGKDRVICSFRSIGNLYWSADCSRLYLSGHDSRSSQSAYIADISMAFGANGN